jgi:hypothetical protein
MSKDARTVTLVVGFFFFSKFEEKNGANRNFNDT